jgi:myo-inositol 2-dehydrogenase/D-chiro-inositol 1-dehydrogenase
LTPGGSQQARSPGKESIINTVRVGILGAGRIGQLHARHLTLDVPEAQIVAVCDLIEGAAQECSEEWGIPGSHRDPDPVLGSDWVDAVFICTSTDTHAQLIEAAAAAGKHIFCEKPIALDLPSIDRALAAVEAAGVKLQIGFNRRFDPNFSAARKQIADGNIGTPHLLRITSRDPAPPPISYIERSGGLFLDMTIHDFDMARHIMGDEIRELFAQGAARIDPRIGEVGDVDTAVVALRFEGGALGVIENSRQATYGYDQRLEVLGDKGRILVSNPPAHTALRSDAKGDHAPPLLPFFLERYGESFRIEARAFIKAILNDQAVPVSGKDARVPVVMALAANRSMEENRPVSLSEIG